MTFLVKILIPIKSDFFNDFFKFSKFAAIFFLSPWRSFKNSYSSQAKWFGCIFLDREKCTFENA